MKRFRSFVIAAALTTAFVAPAQAQDSAAGSGTSVESATCNYLFGSGNLQWCVSNEANLVSVISPAGNQNIGPDNNEGYVICTPTGAYYGLGWGSSGFGAPVLVSLTATSVTISRTTTDGRFTLVSKFTRDTLERDITVQMKLTNNGASTNDVYLARFAHVGVDNDAGDDRWDASIGSLWARDIRAFTASPRFGVSQSSWVGDLFLNTTCSPVSVGPYPGGPGNVFFSVRFNLGTLGVNKSKIVYVAYRSQ
jgi:hypothetical protein